MSIILLFQTHLNFAREFTQAVEMKQVAQQEAERARYLVEKVRKLLNRTYLFINLFFIEHISDDICYNNCELDHP